MKTAVAQLNSLTVPPEVVLKKIKPGMSIFLSTGVAEPRTMVRHIMRSREKNLEDLELVQLVSFGDAISMEALKSQNFRLKTFFSGWAADKAIENGQVDLVPSRFPKIAELIATGQIPIDMAIVQITPPNEAGYCSLGVSVDVAWEAMEQASVTVGEINPKIPRTFGDTFLPVSEFDYLVLAEDDPLYFERWPVDEAMDRAARNAAALIEDGSCLAFSIGPLYEALGRHLKRKRHLGIHSPFFTDPLMELIQAGAVSNRRKESYRGKSLTSYAFGTPELFAWLDHNPLVEFQRIDKVFNPLIIGRNRQFVTVIAARRIDLYGRVGLHVGKGNVATGPSEIVDFFAGAALSEKGRSVFALTSRDPKGRSNIRPTIADAPNQFGLFEAVSTVVTEHGVAYLEGRTVRERAQALIEIAHPDDRAWLVREAKARNILYSDQIFLEGSARLYPMEISATHVFRENLTVRFRPIKPSDEEGMRHLFYRFSDETHYSRYFHSIKSMPHAKMQEYVNVDWSRDMSMVGLVGEEGKGRIIAEGRYLRTLGSSFAELVFVVDEHYQGRGIATHLYAMLTRLAQERGIKGFTADVLFNNLAMMKVFHKGEMPVGAQLEGGVYHLTIPFEPFGKEAKRC
jgi:acyl-CoA hydrolase/GNAT superfamily N-acetyltransferase